MGGAEGREKGEMNALYAFKIMVHVLRDIGRCFEIDPVEFDFALGWLKSENIPRISLTRKDAKKLCACHGDLESRETIEASIHCRTGRCLSVPISTETAKTVLAEFIGRSEVCEIEIWCKGMESDFVCECLGWKAN